MFFQATFIRIILNRSLGLQSDCNNKFLYFNCCNGNTENANRERNAESSDDRAESDANENINEEYSTTPTIHLSGKDQIIETTEYTAQESDELQLTIDTFTIIYRLDHSEEFASIMALGDVHFFFKHFTTALQYYLQSISIPSSFFTTSSSSILLSWLSTTVTTPYLAPPHLCPILCRLISCLHHTHSNVEFRKCGFLCLTFSLQKKFMHWL